MVTKEMIEQAALNYKKEQEKIGKKLLEENPDVAFIDGIKWLLDNIKHPMTDRPGFGDEILLIRDKSKISSGMNANNTFVHELAYNDKWEWYSKSDKYLGWIDTEDLLNLGTLL